MYSSGLDMDRLAALDADGFDGVKAYAQAKRAQVVLNEQWAARFGTTGVMFHAMHPGWADTEGVRSSLPRFHRLVGPILRSPAQGVDTTLWLASADQPRRTNGELWLDRHRRRTVHLPGTAVSVETANRLWNWCVSASGADPERSVESRHDDGSPRAASRS